MHEAISFTVFPLYWTNVRDDCCLRNNLYCVGWAVKLCSLIPCRTEWAVHAKLWLIMNC